MSEIYCIRADFGKYTENFLKGGYIGIHYDVDEDLSTISSKEEVKSIYQKTHPQETSNHVIGVQAAQISRFLLDIQKGDFVITPDLDSDKLYYGIVADGDYYYDPVRADGCGYPHRRPVKWFDEPALRSEFSVPFQNTLRASLTVFKVEHKRNFFETIGRKDLIPSSELYRKLDNSQEVLKAILNLSARDFEILTMELLNGMGFQSEHQGKPGDGGIDVVGELEFENIARIKLKVQAKRYSIGKNISPKQVREFRASVPIHNQGVIITTGGYQKKARLVAQEEGFARISLVNGEQLVDLLVKYWDKINQDFRSQLGLKLGLVADS